MIKLAINVASDLKLCTFNRKNRSISGCNINIEFEEDDDNEIDLTVTLTKNNESDIKKDAIVTFNG